MQKLCNIWMHFALIFLVIILGKAVKLFDCIHAECVHWLTSYQA